MNQLVRALDRILSGRRREEGSGRLAGRGATARLTRSCRFEWLEDRRLLTGDWGDAPVAWGTDVTWHTISGPYLGTDDAPDDDPDGGQPDANALGDDNNGTAPDDEDGIVFYDENNDPFPGVPTLMPGVDFSVQYTIAGGPGGWVRGWIDFNGDGDFTDTDELFLNPGGKAAGTYYSDVVTVPAEATIGTTFARFRIAETNPGSFDPTGHLPTGEVEDYKVLIEAEPDDLDFGDAPDTGAGTGPGNYQTLSADNGASHIIVTGGPYLGLNDRPDAETDGQPDSEARGDDNDGNPDETGLWFPDALLPDSEGKVSFVVGEGGYVRGWIDFNRDGVWANDATELIVDGSFPPGTYHDQPFQVPDIQPGTTFARFRITSTNPTSFDPTGPLDDGEVEDHKVTIEEPQLRDWGDAPEGIPGYPDYLTTSPDGASHLIVPDGPFLGNPSDPTDTGEPDDEEDGQPDADALGDDNNDLNDDENGVVFLDENGDPFPGVPTLVAGEEFTIRYEVDGVGTSQDVTMYGWIDYTGDGSWSDHADELFLEVTGLADGIHEDTRTVPSWVTLDGDTYARFRICDTIYPMVSYGPLENGEVEDYKVTVTVVQEDLDWGDAYQDDETYFYPTRESLNGARHLIVEGGPYFGDPNPDPPLITGEPDPEPDGQPDFYAEGDDYNGYPDDENGVQFLDANGDPFPGVPTLTAGQPFRVMLIVEGTGAPGVRGWIDYNGDQQWDNGEELFLDWGFGVPADTYTTEPIIVPSSVTYEGDTYARFRITSTSEDFDATGRLEDGEVEDYHLQIQAPQYDFGDAPDTGQGTSPGNYQTLLDDDGAGHLIGGPFLGPDGDQPDAEPDGQPTADAFGDDEYVNEDIYDDEGGVIFDPLTPLRIDQDFNITYRVNGGGGAVHGWIDYNADGDWDDPGEHFLNRAEHVAEGQHTETYHVPDNATLGETFARFRIATYEEGMTFEPTGLKDDGEVEDYLVEIFGPEEDFGDAPDTEPGTGPGNYQTLLDDDGARHVILPGGPFLGPADDEPDPELDGQPDDQAEGDDYNDFNDDEDGVIFNPLTPLIVGEPFEITYWVGGSGGAVHGWIDFNADGDWDDPGEHFLTNNFQMLPGEYPDQEYPVPATATPGETFARFRIATYEQGMTFEPTGPMDDGEVEDYRILIEGPPAVTDFGDAPDTDTGTGPGNYQTLAADGGASHVVGGPFLGPDGDEPDTESDGQPHAQALGDDNTGYPDDEDGVTFGTLVPGQEATVTYEINGGGGAVRGWVDFNHNGVWESSEIIVNHASIGDGIEAQPFSVPADAVPGETFARFRITSTQPDPFDPTGALDDGEVEDHRVTIEPPPAEVVGRHIFYNQSAFDGNNQLPTADDDDAVAPDKTALLPGETATFDNYTSYAKGINGIMVDFVGLGGTPTRSDFTFRMGNDSDPGSWPLAPQPQYVTPPRVGAGTGGSDRVMLIWPNYNTVNPDPTTQAVAKNWLQVTVLATANTGLDEPDVFYFGNAVGESGLGNFGGWALVNAVDSGAVRDNPHNPYIVPAPIDDFVDFNRDKWVNAVDFGFVRDNATNPSTALVLITAPSTSPSPGPEGAPATVGGFSPLATTGLLAGESVETGRSTRSAALPSQRLGSNVAAVDTLFGEGGLLVPAEETELPSGGNIGIPGGGKVLAAALRALGDGNAEGEDAETDGLAEPLDEGLLSLIALDQADR